MRIALISDIHGNLMALETVLAEIAGEAPDQIVCLGDVVEGGPHPHAVLQRMQQLGCPIVMGNTDARMRTARSDEPRTPDLPPGYAMELWCVDQLTSDDRAFIQTFQPTINVPLDAESSLLGFHGSPHSNTDLIFATTPEAELGAMLGDAHATILSGGHTHTPLVRRYRDMLFINPGSVGLPYEKIGPDSIFRRPLWAEYALVTVTHGRVSVDLRRTPIDLAALSDSVAQSRMPYPELWLEDWK